jgi:hypothetical protein
MGGDTAEPPTKQRQASPHAEAWVEVALGQESQEKVARFPVRVEWNYPEGGPAGGVKQEHGLGAEVFSAGEVRRC